jgi:hypothetical protein
MNTIFASIPVGSRFECNGNVCIKQSTRTAVLEQFGRVFYFGMKDRVRILGMA